MKPPFGLPRSLLAFGALGLLWLRCALAQQDIAATAAAAPTPSSGEAYLPLQSTLRDPAWEAARRPLVFVQRSSDPAARKAGGTEQKAPRQLAWLGRESGTVGLRLVFPVSQADKTAQVTCLGGGTLSGAGKGSVSERIKIGVDGSASLVYQPPAGSGRFTVLVELEGVRTALRLVSN